MSDEEDRTVDVDRIRELIDLLIEKDVAELEIEKDGVKVKIRRREEGPPQVIAASPAVAAAPSGAGAQEGPAPAGEPESVAEAEGFGDAYIVTSPIVGTFYRASDPDSDPFIEVGDQVEEGQTLCIVEAMKLMNEISSEVSGEVLAVFVDDAEPVEYGQQLFAIRPDSG